MGVRRAHLVVGLRAVGDEPHFLEAAEECALGLLDDDQGLAVCTDALRDAELAPLVLATVRGVATRPGAVGIVRDDDDGTVLDCGDRGDLTVFPWLSDRARPDVDLLEALDEAGFNHVAAPLVRWRAEGRDLGVVQEPLADRSGGWALALTSLRDLYAAGGLARGRRRGLRRRGTGAGGHDGAHAPGAGPGLPAPPRAGGRLGGRSRGADRRRRSDAARGPRRGRAGEVDPRVRGAPPGDPHPRGLPPRAHGADRPGLDGGGLPPRRRLERGVVPGAPHATGRRGRPPVVDASGQRRRGGRARPHRPARPGRSWVRRGSAGTAAPS